jgi:dephospho-CoA kinase
LVYIFNTFILIMSAHRIGTGEGGGAAQRLIGLTGGIATGKTTVSRYLETVHHLPVLDADVYARQAVEPGSIVLSRIVQHYGVEILQGDGTLNRRQLGDIIFKNSAQRYWLEQQIHPDVRIRLLQAVQASDPDRQPILVLAIPLLFEAQMTDLVTEIWVVTCSSAQQLERLLNRDHLTVEQAQARIDSQIPLATKIAMADIVLDNSTTLESLYQQIDAALI